MYATIQNITTERSGNIKIKAQIQSIKRFTTSNNKKCMCIKIRDIHGSQIQCMFWQDVFAKFDKIMQYAQTYVFSKFKIQKVKYPRFNETMHEYEMIACSKTIIKKVNASFLANVENDKLECVEINCKRQKVRKKMCKKILRG